MSSGTDFGSNSKTTDFKAGDVLSGGITACNVEKLKKKVLDTELQVESIPNAEVKAILLHALTERNMLKGSVKSVEMTEMQFQLEMKKLEIQEREKREQIEHELQKAREEREEREAEKQRQFELQKATEEK